MHDRLVEAAAREQIKDRIRRASAPRVRNHRRHQLASRLRRVADRLDS